MEVKVITEGVVVRNYDKFILTHLVVYDLVKLLAKDKKMYFYRFDVKDLIEVTFEKDLITMVEFPHTSVDAVDKFRNEIQFLTGYFKSAGLEGKTFLYDMKVKLPVTFADFEEKKQPFIDNKRTVAVIFDKIEDLRYLTRPFQVFVNSSITPLTTINNAIMGLYNLRNLMTKPKDLIHHDGTICAIILGGLFSGISSEDLYSCDQINNENDRISTCFKVNPAAINSESFVKLCNEIKSQKLEKLLYFPVNNDDLFASDTVNLSRLINIGVGNFIKTLDNMKKKIDINIDVPQIGIKSMYINNGAVFITTDSRLRVSLEVIQELLMFEEVYEIIS